MVHPTGTPGPPVHCGVGGFAGMTLNNDVLANEIDPLYGGSELS